MRARIRVRDCEPRSSRSPRPSGAPRPGRSLSTDHEDRHSYPCRRRRRDPRRRLARRRADRLRNRAGRRESGASGRRRPGHHRPPRPGRAAAARPASSASPSAPRPSPRTTTPAPTSPGTCRTLGPDGVIRVGGNSGDGTFWTSTGEAAPAWATSGTITPDKLQSPRRDRARDRLEGDPRGEPQAPATRRSAADEAKYARQLFGRSLLAIEVGNEPNFYVTDAAAYYADFETYASAIRAAVPGMRPDRARRRDQPQPPGSAASPRRRRAPGRLRGHRPHLPDERLRRPGRDHPAAARAPPRCSTRPPTRRRR